MADEQKPKLPEARKPYYELQDGLWTLAAVIENTNDPELKYLMSKAREAVFEFESAMSKKYAWD